MSRRGRRQPPQPPASPLERCPNCDAPLDDQYCPHCGQNNRLSRLDTKEILGTAFEHLADLDVPLFRTFAGMTVRPGRLCRAYVEGRRKRYSNPIRYAFLMACLLLLTFTVLDVDPAAALGSSPTILAASDAPRLERVTAHINANASDHVRQNLNIVSFFALPAVAAALLLLFRSARLTYGEHLAFALFTYGHLFFANAIFCALGMFEDWRGLLANQIFEFAYLTWAGVQFYGRSVPSTVWRMVLAACMYMIANLILSTALIVAWAFYIAFFGDV